jgi:hypothetical protein
MLARREQQEEEELLATPQEEEEERQVLPGRQREGQEQAAQLEDDPAHQARRTAVMTPKMVHTLDAGW